MKKLKNFLARHRLPQGRKKTSPESEPATPKPKDICLAKLEQVPFDIRHQILLAVDTVEDLQALVHASPTYHRQYLPRRDFWLWRCLWLDIGDALIDAYTADLCSSPGLMRKRTPEHVREFIAAYKIQRSVPSETLLTLPGTEDNLPITEEIVRIAAVHCATIRPLVQEYVTWTRSNLNALSLPDELSKTEQRRIIRGLYRFQIFCKLFGCSYNHRERSFSSEGKLSLFLCIYEPWEIEEIACINTFADATYERVFTEVEWDLHPDNPRFDPVRRDLFTPPGTFDLNCHDRDWYRNGMSSVGLALLSATLQTREHSALVELISKNLISQGPEWIQEAVNNCTQDERREKGLSDRDKAQDRRDEMPFRGDRNDLPPMAWVTIWQGTYSNLVGNHLPFTFLDWGYVMWDAYRLHKNGAMDVLDQQWRTMYTNEYGELDDPRNEM